MAMLESAFWRNIRLSQPKWVKKCGRLQRIESATQSGIPDVYYTINGNSGWIELKVIGSLPCKDTGTLKVNHYRAVQRKWIREEQQCGGKAYVFLLADTPSGREYFLLNGSATEELGKTLTLKKARECALFNCTDKVTWDIFWETVLACKKRY